MKSLKPFFCYYGGKWRAAYRYPPPTFSDIVEPFAGAAGYSCRYYSKNVHLYEIDPLIAGLWDYLIHVKESEIIGLPNQITNLDDMQLTQEQKWLIGFWLNKGGTTPKKSPSKWMKQGLAPNSWWGEELKKRISDQLKYIRHWRIYNSSYNNADNFQATWFVDPPYQNSAGKIYSCKFHDYESLSQFCISRKGQTIVCEQKGANWLPFKDLCEIKSTPGKRGKSYSAEAIWENNL
jgi:site-specific DNA-adenine methylase